MSPLNERVIRNMSFKRILLVGANGQVGFELQPMLVPLGQVIAVTRADCDLCYPDQILKLLQKYQPHIIVNAAAYTAVDEAEHNVVSAQAINQQAVSLFAHWAYKNQALLIHYSTDYVFDGCKVGAYLEEDTPNPQSVYGKTKWAGEVAIHRSGCAYLIFRTSWIFSLQGKNFLTTMLELMQTQTRLKVINDQFGVPTSAKRLATISTHILQHYLESNASRGFPFGTYHVVPQGETNWYRYACMIHQNATEFRASLRCASEDILPIASHEYISQTPRPANSRLSIHKLQNVFKIDLPPWQEDVKHTIHQYLSYSKTSH